MRFVTVTGLSLLQFLFTCALGLCADELGWPDSVQDALRRAESSDRPVLVVITDPNDLGSMEAADRLIRASELKLLLRRFVPMRMRLSAAPSQGFPWLPGSGFVFLTSRGEFVAYEPIPMMAAHWRSALWNVLANLRPARALVADAQTTGDSRHIRRAFEVLRKARMTDEALALAKSLTKGRFEAAGIGLSHGDALAEFKALGPLHLALRLESWARWFDRLGSAGASPSPATDFGIVLRAFSMLPPTIGPNKAPFDSVLKPFRDAIARKGSGDRIRSGLNMCAGILRQHAKRLRAEARDRQSAFVGANPNRLDVQLAMLRTHLTQSHADKGARDQAKQTLKRLLRRRLKEEDLHRMAAIVTHAIVALNWPEAHEAWITRLEDECDSGRAIALAYLRMADWALSRGESRDAKKLYKRAERAADRESDMLRRAARTRLEILEGRSGPRRSKWAKRKALDVLILVEDLASFAEAISAWDHKTFFPVLFKDDIFAPKFAAAFRPDKVVLIPANPMAADRLGHDKLMRTVYASWNRERRGRGGMRRNVLRERLEGIDEDLSGVVFVDGVSGETAGGLALAAGRFQGIEVLGSPRIEGAQAFGPHDVVSFRAASSWAKDIRKRMTGWGLPARSRLSAITLAGRYPCQYRMDAIHTEAHALDDLLGRNRDGSRVALAARLAGGREQSVYQAMCSLFLRPDSAIVLDDMAGKKANARRTDDPLRRLGFRTSFLTGANGSYDAFRTGTTPWNRRGLMLIGTQGDSRHWKLGMTRATVDDIPVGGPAAMRFAHPGSAPWTQDLSGFGGRALWGGAFWYHGAVAEPYRKAFPSPLTTARLIAEGAPLAVACRRFVGQPFWQPWRTTIVGDPQFCLRKKPVDRKRLKSSDKPFIRKGEAFIASDAKVARRFAQRSSTYGEWLAALRKGRWSADRRLIKRLVSQRAFAKRVDGPALAAVLAEALNLEEPQTAIDWWTAAPDSARRHIGAQIHARQAIRVGLEHNWRTGSLKSLRSLLRQLLAAAPDPEAVTLWLDRLGERAKAAKAMDQFKTWLATIASDGTLNAYRHLIEARLNK